MSMEIDVERLVEFKITASQYLILHLLWENKKETCRKYYAIDPGFLKDIEVLKSKGYILKFDASSFILDKPKCSKVFNLEDTYFWELYSTYPIKVNEGKGTRALRAISTTSRDAKVCRDKYKSVVKTATKHAFVMRCLQAELSERKKTNKMMYMHKLEVWINQRHWERYEYLLEQADKEPINKTSYGTNLV